VNSYTLELENDQLLNILPLIKFLKENEGRDVNLIVNQESHCLRYTNVYDLVDLFTFKSVTFESLNAIESHDTYNIPDNDWDHWLTTKNIKFHNFSKDHSWNYSKIFGCFYGRPSAARLGIASYLYSQHLEKSLIKFKFDSSNEDTRKNFEMTKLFSWDPDRITDVSSMLKTISQSNYNAYNYKTGEYDFSNPLSDLYEDIFLDIISEASIMGDSFYPTEKFSRAVLCKKPFIAMAPKSYLKYLKQMGFKTFSYWWNESYDDLAAKDRYFAILKLIDYIASLSESNILDLTNDMKSTLEYNYQLLVDQKFSRDIVKIGN
jgi:hypothetical protein